MTPVEKTRFVQRFRLFIETSCEEEAARLGVPVEEVQSVAHECLLEDLDCEAIVEAESENVKDSEYGAVVDSLRTIWEFLSRPNVAASAQGWNLRRDLLGCIAGPRLTFPAAKRILGGNLKQEPFKQAKRRRTEALAKQDLDLL